MFRHKSFDEKFETLDEFIDNLVRGGEIEFFFDNKKYSITHPDGMLCIIKIGCESSDKVFGSIQELLDYRIDEQKICDIVTKIEPYFRCF